MMVDQKMQKKVNTQFCFMQGSYVGGNAVLFGYAVVLLQSKSLTATEAGLALALCSVASIFIQPAVAAISNRFRRIPLNHLMGYISIIVLLGSIALYFIDAPMLAVMIVFILTASIEMSVMTFIGAFAMQFENRGMGINYGASRAVGSICYALLGFAMGWLVDEFGAGAILPVYCALVVVIILVGFLHITPDKAMPLPRPEEWETKKAEEPKRKAIDLIRGKPFMILYFLAILCINVNHMVLDSYQVSIVQEQGGSTGNYGTVMLIMAFCELPSLFLFKRLARRFGCGKLLIAGMLAFALKDVALFLSPSVEWVYISQVFNLCTVGVYMPAMVYFTNELVDAESNVSAQTLIVGVAGGIGKVVGNFMGGALIDMGGTRLMLVGTFLIMVAGVGLMLATMGALRRHGIQAR